MAIKSNTWRTQRVTVKAGVVTPLDFTDTSPNVVQVRNNASDIVFLNYSPVVDNTKYEISIGVGMTRNYASPKQFKSVYFYSATDCEIVVNSAECDEFYPTDLDQTQPTTASDGGNLTFGSMADTLTQDPTATNKSFMSYVKGILKTIKDVITANKVQVDVVTIPEVEIKNDSGNPVPTSLPTATETKFTNIESHANTLANAVTLNKVQVDVVTIPEVEIKNDVGNPVPVSGSVSITGSVEITNDAGSPIPISFYEFGGWGDTLTQDPTATNKSFISYVKGILKTMLDVIAANKVQVDVVTIPEVEIKNDVGNPVPIQIIPSQPTPLKVTLSAGVDYSVKGVAGFVYAISTALTDVLVLDGTTEVFKGNYSGQPFYCHTSIKLNSATGGVVYIVYY